MAKTIRQLSVFVENKAGSLSEVLKLIGGEKIDIRAMSIADTKDFGILRLIVSDTDKAIDILKKNDYPVTVTEVIAISVSDTPGGLAGAIGILDGCGISIEYMYAFISGADNTADIIFRVDDNEKASEALVKNGCVLLDDETVRK